MITTSKRITPHFHSTEFKCKCGCGVIKIDEGLVEKLEKLHTTMKCSKVIISSGYRCSKHDKAVGGSGRGQHTLGRAADCIFYDKDGGIIPSKIVICAAFDLGLFSGYAKINNNYSHFDTRTSGTYRGDETKGLSSYWTNPYSYFSVSKSDVTKYTGNKQSLDEVAKRVIKGEYGNYPERKQKLEAEGYNYKEVQNRVNQLLK